MTGPGNNTYLFVTENGPGTLIDAGVGHPGHLADLSRELDARDARLTDRIGDSRSSRSRRRASGDRRRASRRRSSPSIPGLVMTPPTAWSGVRRRRRNRPCRRRVVAGAPHAGALARPSRVLARAEPDDIHRRSGRAGQQRDDPLERRRQFVAVSGVARTAPGARAATAAAGTRAERRRSAAAADWLSRRTAACGNSRCSRRFAPGHARCRRSRNPSIMVSARRCCGGARERARAPRKTQTRRHRHRSGRSMDAS